MSDLDLLVVGDLNPDVIVAAHQLTPEFGQVEQIVDRASLVLGGSAAITAVGAARLGLTVGLCAVLGDDDLGQLMTHRLIDAGVDVRYLRVDPSVETGMSVILDRGNDRSVLTATGSIVALSPEDLDGLPDQPAAHVHASSYYLMGHSYRAALPDAFRRFRAAGTHTSVDTNWDPDRVWDLEALLAQTDLFLPNEAEATAIGGSPILERAIQQVSHLGCDVAVKRGSQGATALMGGRGLRVSRVPAIDFVDAVGAGDTFNAGLLTGRLRGRDPATSLAMGVIAGTLSTAAVGGTEAELSLEAVESWLPSVAAIEVAFE
ncbi:MAG: sugar kinase [Actinomycetes bacterium]